MYNPFKPLIALVDRSQGQVNKKSPPSRPEHRLDDPTISHPKSPEVIPYLDERLQQVISPGDSHDSGYADSCRESRNFNKKKTGN